MIVLVSISATFIMTYVKYFLLTHLDIRKWRMAVIDQELLHLFSRFKNGVIQKLEKWRENALALTDSTAEGLIYIYDSFEVSQGIRSPLISLENNFRKF